MCSIIDRMKTNSVPTDYHRKAFDLTPIGSCPGEFSTVECTGQLR